MNQFSLPILSTLIFFPLLCVFLLMFIRSEGGKNDELLRKIALAASVIEFLISLLLLVRFDAAVPGMQFVEFVPWVESFSLNYHVGIGRDKPLARYFDHFFRTVMRAVFMDLYKGKNQVFSDRRAVPRKRNDRHFCCPRSYCLLYFLGSDVDSHVSSHRRLGRNAASIPAVKFFLYTAAGSIFMLVAIIYLYYYSYKTTGTGTFNLLELYNLHIPISAQFWLCAAFSLAFAIKVPIFPLHTWLPDAHVEAPTAGSVLLAAILLKMGTYGFLRFSMPLFPYATHQFLPLIAFLAIAGIIYAALVAWVQPDMKKLVAYSSVSHLGFVMLGLFALNIQGIEGGIYQMLNHGVNTGALFFSSA